MKIIKVIPIPQPGNNGYYWFYGHGSDNRMYIWHEKKADWVLHAKKQYE